MIFQATHHNLKGKKHVRHDPLNKKRWQQEEAEELKEEGELETVFFASEIIQNTSTMVVHKLR